MHTWPAPHVPVIPGHGGALRLYVPVLDQAMSTGGPATGTIAVCGITPSGGTITAGLLMGYTREAAARYSFLLAIPAVLGSGFYQLAKSGGSGGSAGGLATAVATVVAFGVAYVVIVWFLRIISTHTFWPFVAYRLGFALVIVVLLLTGVVDAVDPAAVAAGP